MFFYNAKIGQKLHKLKLRRAKETMRVRAASTCLLVTEDWCLTKLTCTAYGWLQGMGSGGFICYYCLHVVRDATDLGRHMTTHMN